MERKPPRNERFGRLKRLGLYALIPIFQCACGEGLPSGELQVATYNAGLAPGFVDYAAERAPQTVQATAELDVDVLCVQEFWEDRIGELTEAAGTSLPNSVTRAPDPGDPSSCTLEEAAPLFECGREFCGDVDPGELADCALANCEEEVDALSSPCLNCVSSELGNTLDEIEAACTGAGSGSYAYGGSFGTGILTADPILAEDSLLFDSQLNRRAALYALVDSDLGEVHVFCTHLTADLSVPYPGEESWEAEQAAQIDEMLAFIDGKAAPGEQVILLGDLNTGPETETTSAELPGNYRPFVDAAFENPYLQQASPPCTFCADNPLADAGGSSKIIDHILLRDLPAEASAERILTGTTSIERDGETVETAYSDHYGQLLSIER